MLILTAEALPSLPNFRIADWPGPSVLILTPTAEGSRLPPDKVQTLIRDFIVLELAQAADRASALLAPLFALPRDWSGDAEWPLLFVAGAPTADDLAAAQLIEPFGLRGDLDSHGRLSRLILGDMVLSSPLLSRALAQAQARAADDSTLLSTLTTLFARS